MKQILLYLTSLFLSTGIQAQVTVSSTVFNEIDVCGDHKSFLVKVINQKTGAAISPLVSCNLPEGMEYVPGSILQLNGNIVSSNIFDLSAPVFNAANISAGDSLFFEIKIKALVPAIAEQQSGTVFRNTVEYSDNQDQESHLSNAYNILYPAMSITNVSPTSITGLNGQQVQRQITIVNAGYGKCESLRISDIRNNVGLSLSATSIGTIDSNGEIIHISGADLMTIGNNDAYFDFGETLTITETLDLSGCNNVTVSSAIAVHWGCESDSISTTNSNAHVTIGQKNPNISISSDNVPSTCVGSPSKASLTLTNNGQGLATNLTLEIYKSSGNGYDEDIFSRIDETSFTYSINGGAIISFTPQTTNTRDDGPYACLGNSPIGKVEYSAPFDLAPGDQVLVSWDMYQCCISECLEQGNMGWKYGITYQDFCLNNNYSKGGTGEGPTELNAFIFTETPTDLFEGEIIENSYHISSWENNLAQGQGAHYKLQFILPAGLVWSGNSSDLKWEVNNISWFPNNVTYNQVSSALEATFPLPSPFIIPKSEIKLSLQGFCNGGINSGTQTTDLSIFYVANDTCSNVCEVAMICNEQVQSDLHCPIGACEGLYFYGFDTYRTSFGLPDNDINGLADASGNIDLNKIEIGRSMMGDTIRTIAKGLVMSSIGQSFNYLYAESDIELGSLMEPFRASVVIYDASQGVSFSCDQVTISHYTSGTDRVCRYAVSPPQLHNQGCADFANFAFEAGDSISLQVDYRMVSNLGPSVKEILIENQFFLSQSTNPWNSSATKYSCDSRKGRHTLIGYEFVNESRNNYNFTTCTKTIRQSFRLSIGDCCDNYQGGNLFPYEYRNWAHLKEAIVTIPDHYEFVDAYFTQSRTKATNSKANQSVYNITPTGSSPVVLHFDLETLYQDYGGTISLSDDGFSGTLNVELAPSCDVAINTYEDVEWRCKFAQSDYIGGGTSNWIYPDLNDRVKYNPTNLTLSSVNPIQDGENRSVIWPITINNPASNFKADNVWLHFKCPSEQMEVICLKNDVGDTLFLDGDIYKIGDINKNSSETYYLTCTYSACAPDYIVAYTGYECSAYPDSFAYFYCPYTTYPLHVEPKPAAFQTRIYGETLGGNCSNTLQLEVDMASVKFGHLDSMRIRFESTNNAISYIPGSTTLSYPTGASDISVSDPENDQGLVYKMENLSAYLRENGLPGVGDIANSRFKLKFNLNIESYYKTGDYVSVQLTATEMCQLQLPTINLAYDPAIEFDSDSNTGLTNQSTNTWGVAWVDYNGDGYDDCFVSNYENSQGNLLYRNEGNGTFTSVNAGSLTQLAMNTVSSTWADFDNDGDLDVFLANNVGASNMLYSNAGNGTFSLDTSLNLNKYSGYCHNATWVDYDNDGFTDLFVTDYMATKYNLLYHNNGDGSFTKISNSAITMDPMKSIGSTWADYDNDGDLDAFVPNTNGENNALYTNIGNGDFIRVSTGDVATDGGNSVGCSWGDYDNDGYLDLFVANTGEEADFLYHNNQGQSFTKVLIPGLTTDLYNSSGSSWIDIDNDGDLDLFISRDLGTPSALYINTGNGSFSLSNINLSEVLGNSYPNAWSDYDRDGDMDVFIGNRNMETDVVFENKRGSCNNFLCFDLIGTMSNKSAIGAKVRVLAHINGTPVWQLREISAQTGGGAGSQNSLTANFGLGDATQADSVIIEWPSGLKQSITNLMAGGCNTITEPLGNEVCGEIFNDENGNCVKDTGEQTLPNRMIEILPGPRYVTSKEDGSYSIYLEDGNYSFTVLENATWINSCPTPTTINLNGEDTCGVNFGLNTLCQGTDLEVSSGATAFRRGFKNTIVVNCKNNSSVDATSVILDIELDDELEILSSDLQWNSINYLDSTISYRWEIASIPAFSSVTITLIDSVDLYATLGDSLTVSSTIQAFETDCFMSNNTYSERGEVVGSVDPNDKLVSPSIHNGIADITDEDVLHYKIRFQNVGNYYASRVIIKDTLSPYLDLSTLEFGTCSHKFSASLEDGILTWMVDDIILPDSSESEELSQGFVSFTVKALKNTPSESLIANRASIQFDYNDEIITNEVYNRFINYQSSKEAALMAELFPNPCTDHINVAMLVRRNKIYLPIEQITIQNALGKITHMLPIPGQKHVVVDLANEPPGVYLIKITDILGRTVSDKFVRVEGE